MAEQNPVSTLQNDSTSENPIAQKSTNAAAHVTQSYLHSHVTSDTQILGAAGFLHSLTFAQTDAAPTAGTIIVYDSLTEAGTIIYSETFTTTTFRGYTVILDVVCATGLYVGFTTTTDVGCTASYRLDA